MNVTTTATGRLFKALVVFLFLVFAVHLIAGQDTQEAPKSAATQAKTDSTVPAGGDGDYVGSDVCVTCHEIQGRRFNHTAMGKAMAHPRTPDEAHGCESCH